MWPVFFVSSLIVLLLGGCANDPSGKPSIILESGRPVPPPLPVSAPLPEPKAKAKPVKREATPPPLPVARPTPAPAPVPPATPAKEPPHYWYDHLKFWQK